MMSKRIRWVAGVGAILCLALLGGQGQPQPKINTRDVMKFKLFYAQGVLEGITMENFDLVATNANKLVSLSQAADWQVRQTPEYQKFTTDYARHASALGKAARNRNVDAATVAYFQLTVSCVNCHRYLRGAGTAGNGFVAPQLPLVKIPPSSQPLPSPSNIAAAW
jgi:hypothetical protein